jgi:hypothetical protein
VNFQGWSGNGPRSGRGGRRFKSCHSDQHLASSETSIPTVSPTDTTRESDAGAYRGSGGMVHRDSYRDRNDSHIRTGAEPRESRTRKLGVYRSNFRFFADRGSAMVGRASPLWQLCVLESSRQHRAPAGHEHIGPGFSSRFAGDFHAAKALGLEVPPALTGQTMS